MTERTCYFSFGTGLLIIAFSIFLLVESSTAKKEVGKLSIQWKRDSGVRLDSGSVPFAYKISSGSEKNKIRLYYCADGAIKSALSNEGTFFQVEPGNRLQPTDELGGPALVCDPTIVSLKGSKIRMYYKAGSSMEGATAVHSIFSATSANGLDFTKEGIRVDSQTSGDFGWASVPDAVKLPNGKVRLYYVTRDFAAKGGIVSAISANGLSFSREGVALKELADPSVMVLSESCYLMIAAKLYSPEELGGQPAPGTITPTHGLYSFTSKDGKKFSNGKKILSSRGSYDPAIVRLSPTKFKIYFGNNSGTTTSPDLNVASLTGKLKSKKFLCA